MEGRRLCAGRTGRGTRIGISLCGSRHHSRSSRGSRRVHPRMAEGPDSGQRSDLHRRFPGLQGRRIPARTATKHGDMIDKKSPRPRGRGLLLFEVLLRNAEGLLPRSRLLARKTARAGLPGSPPGTPPSSFAVFLANLDCSRREQSGTAREFFKLQKIVLSSERRHCTRFKSIATIDARPSFHVSLVKVHRENTFSSKILG